MSRLRTFIAVDLTKAIRDRAVSLQERLATGGFDVKWVEPENLHVTLLFLGEVDEREVISVCRSAAACCEKMPPFPMSIETVGCFPNMRRPRVVWIGVGEGSQELCTLHDALETPLLELGCYRRENRKYTPHITLGRIKNDRPTEALATALTRHTGWKGGQTLVREILVLSSNLTSDGPEYAVLSRAKLRGE